MMRRLGAGVVLMLLVASCSRSSSTTSAPITSATPPTVVTTTSTTSAPEPAVTQHMQLGFVVREDDLPVELRTLVPEGVVLGDGPRHFSTFKWQWLELPFESVDVVWLPGRAAAGTPTPSGLVSGTQLADTLEEAIARFTEGVADSIDVDGAVTFEVPELGEESVGLTTHVVEGTSSRWDTSVVFRRGRLLAHVTMTRNEAVDDRVVVTELAQLLAGRIEAVVAGDYSISVIDDDRFRRGTATPRQLGSYAFELSVEVESNGRVFAIRSVGEFLAPDLMWCEIEGVGETTRLMSQGDSVVVDVGAGWEPVDGRSDEVLDLLSICPGHVLFFDESLPLWEQDFLIIGAGARGREEYVHPDAVAASESGVEVRRYVLDASFREWVELVEFAVIAKGPHGGMFPDRIGAFTDLEVSFAVDGGWVSHLRFAAPLEPISLLESELAGGPSPTTIEYRIMRPNDPSISFDFPPTATDI